jgi:alkanesulfonate monooxygenase SsuD/methylene tetrahydromethanopterin reductase-like flavin-dependent oxidoreductase (luciferase family)
MSGMNVGVYIDAHLGIGEHARRLEDAGFSHLWIYDSPLVFGEPYMAALEAARATERIVIGPGVTHPGSRPATATAQALATLAKAAPGRVAFGVGIGSSARHSLGMRPATLDQLHDYVRVVRAMLAGGEAQYREGDHTHPVAFIQPHGRWVDVDHDVETWISAFGPKGQRRAGSQADGVMVRWEGEERLEQACEHVRAGAREAGRDPDAVRLGVLFAVYPVSDPNELDGEEARAALGPLVVSRLRYLTANYSSAEDVPAVFRDGFLAYREYREGLDPYRRHLENYQGYLTLTPEHLERFVTPQSIRTVCHVADSDGVAAELQRMADAGAAHASLQIAGPPAAWCERMGREVLPRLR